MAGTRIHNMELLDSQIGQIRFVVPSVVISELDRLCSNEAKSMQARAALDCCSKMPVLDMDGKYADDAILERIDNAGGLVATQDRELKSRVRARGGGIITIHDNKIILEG